MMSTDELRRAIIEYVRKKGRVQIHEVKTAMGLQGSQLGVYGSEALTKVWEDLLQSGDIELCEGYHPNYYLAKYRVRTQMRLL